MIILCDIDGTLDLGSGRVNEPLVAALNGSGDEVIVVSARQDSRLTETRAWLNDSGLKFVGLHLSDFPTGPNANVAFKKFKAEALLAEGKDIQAAIDNDAAARAVYREVGLDAYSPGEFISSHGGRSNEVASDAAMISEAVAADAARSEGEEMGIEFRTATAELRAVDPEGFTFEGMAAVYDSPSADGTTPEVVKPGAFARSLAAAQRGEWDIKAYADHNPERLLGTTKTGTLELTDTAEGLRARVKLNPNVSFHRDLAEIVRTMGKSLGLSFGFFSTNANRVNDQGVRELREVKLVEVSALTGLSPYYPSTISTVSVRSLASEAGIEIEPLRAAVNALLAGSVTPDQAKILGDAVNAVIAEDDAEMAQGEDVAPMDAAPADAAPMDAAPMEDPMANVSEDDSSESVEISVEITIPRAVPRAIREKQIELAKRALK